MPIGLCVVWDGYLVLDIIILYDELNVVGGELCPSIYEYLPWHPKYDEYFPCRGSTLLTFLWILGMLWPPST